MRPDIRRACRDALQRVFGVPGYRPGQRAAALCLLRGRDLLCILPTGAGKSLCWQLPAVVHEGLTVVVSPLLALMHDQVASLRRRGVAAVSIDSMMTPEDRREAERQIRAGETRILFVSPERLENPYFRRLCADCPPWLLVVDEAHCVVQWGEEFRPAYERIGCFAASLPIRPVICAMTATADRRMQRQIVAGLGMRLRRRVMLPVVRPNLVCSAVPVNSRSQEILDVMRRSPCKTVVFCRTRSRTEELAAWLQRAGLQAGAYHAGMDRGERLRVQEQFRMGEAQILAATTAFGMGVDIPDVRRVIHDAVPDSIIDYAQQTGRAGRDGLPAECIVLLSADDLPRRAAAMSSLFHHTFWFSVKRWHMLHRWWGPLRALLKVLLCGSCIPRGIAAAFGQRVGPCGMCSACRQGPVTPAIPDFPRVGPEHAAQWLRRMQRGHETHSEETD